jgi:pimeloyl-ACP methyl ester carboxylesterase
MEEVCHSAEMMAVQLGSTDDSFRIAYKPFGNPSDQLAVLVHGFPDTYRTWDAIAPEIAKVGFYCVAIAQRGYPPSGIPPNGRYDVSELGRDILGVIKGLGRSGAFLVGHDWGASAVYAAAAWDEIDNTGLVARVVGIAIPPPVAISFSASGLYKLRHFLYFNSPFVDVYKGTRARDWAYIDELFKRWSPTWQLDSKARLAALAAVRGDLKEEGRLEAAIGYYKDYFKNVRDVKVISAHVYRMPFLFIFGAQDGGGGFEDNYRLAHTQCAGYSETIVVPGIGHFVHLEAPAVFIDHVVGFILKCNKVSTCEQSSGK